MQGVDVSECAADFARRVFDVDVLTADIEALDFERNEFDVVTLWHIIEHFRNPLAALEKIKRLMKRKGILFVETPNINSIFRKIYRRYWIGFSPFHLWHFSPSSLKVLLERAGFSLMVLYTERTELFSREGLWERGIKTFMAALLEKLRLKDVVQNMLPKKEASGDFTVECCQI